jgi:peptidoglycan/LPS O-acetylase OafA/YrhL
MEETNSFTINRYPSLNGLRALSIIAVIGCHLALHYPAYLPSLPLLTDGQFGVNVFFVISGFLITRLLMKEEFFNKRVSLKKFYIRRTLRIFPAYYFLLFIYFLLTCFGYIHISAQSWLTSLTYTKYFNWNRDWYTTHAWSLSMEEHFYLLWPLFFVLGLKSRKYFILFVLVTVPVCRVVFYYHPVSWINPLTIFYRFDAIATGCLFALYQDRIIKVLSRNWKRNFYIAVTLMVLLPGVQFINHRAHLHLDSFTAAFGTTEGTIANFLIAIILMCSVFGSRGLWFAFLNSGIMNQIGLWSYSIYLWQQLFLSPKDLPYFVSTFPVNLLFIFIAAMISYYLIEKPFLRLKTKFSFQKTEQAKGDNPGHIPVNTP